MGLRYEVHPTHYIPLKKIQPIYIPLNDLFGLDMKLRSTQPIIMKVHDLFVLDMKLKLGGKNLSHLFGLSSYYDFSP